MHSKDEYLALVRKSPWGGLGFRANPPVPVEWVREAWELPEIQGNVIPGGIVREVSKTGSLCLDPGYLASLSATLTTAQVAQLYLTIRESCATREEEFRPEFLAAFARHAHAIPPALTRDEITARLGMTAEEAVRYWQEVDHPPWLNQPATSQPIESDDDIPF
jgi:hypothetical protein